MSSKRGSGVSVKEQAGSRFSPPPLPTPISSTMLVQPHCPHHHKKLRLSLLICTLNMGNAIPSAKDVEKLLPGGTEMQDVVVIGAQEATFTHGSAHTQPPTPPDAIDSTSSGLKGAGADGRPPVPPRRSSVDSRKSSISGTAKRGSRKSSAALIPIKAIARLASNIRSATVTEDLNRKASVVGGHYDPTHASHDTKAFVSMLAGRLRGFEQVVCYQRGEMRLLVYVRAPLMPSLIDVEVVAENTGLGHVLANKGGIVARVTLGETSLCFISCHLQAHEGKDNYVRRCHDLKEIFSGAKVGGRKRYDASLVNHHCFVLGDLNYRVDHPKDDVIDLLTSGDYAGCYKHDELSRGMALGDCLADFEGADCSHFPPTFKVKRGVKGYLKGGKVEDVYNLQRTPSYCDRILWHSLDGLKEDLECTSFGDVGDYEASDHKPVRGIFHVDVMGRYDTRNHISSALLPRKESLLEERHRASSTTHDTTMIIKHHNTEEMDFDLDNGESKGEHQVHLDHDADPELDGNSDEDEEGDEGEMVDKVCRVIFSKMRATNLTEMDPQLTGGGSDPYVSFVPLTEHLYTHRHMRRVSRLSGNAYFHKFPKTRTIRHELNPVWDGDVVEIEINVKSRMELRYSKFIAVTLMDHDTLNEDDVIGTVVLNLKGLVSKGGDDEGEEEGATKRTSRMSNVLGMSPKSSSAMRISRPVMKNGIVQGHFECDAEVKWTDVNYGRQSLRRSVRMGGAVGCGCVVA